MSANKTPQLGRQKCRAPRLLARSERLTSAASHEASSCQPTRAVLWQAHDAPGTRDSAQGRGPLRRRPQLAVPRKGCAGCQRSREGGRKREVDENRPRLIGRTRVRGLVGRLPTSNMMVLAIRVTITLLEFCRVPGHVGVTPARPNLSGPGTFRTAKPRPPRRSMWP